MPLPTGTRSRPTRSTSHRCGHGTAEEQRPNFSVDLATLHVAIYDAVNAIVGTHKPFGAAPATSATGASQEAAAAAAAYGVLKGLFPESRGAVSEPHTTTSSPRSRRTMPRPVASPSEPKSRPPSSRCAPTMAASTAVSLHRRNRTGQLSRCQSGRHVQSLHEAVRGDELVSVPCRSAAGARQRGLRRRRQRSARFGRNHQQHAQRGPTGKLPASTPKPRRSSLTRNYRAFAMDSRSLADNARGMAHAVGRAGRRRDTVLRDEVLL